MKTLIVRNQSVEITPQQAGFIQLQVQMDVEILASDLVVAFNFIGALMEKEMQLTQLGAPQEDIDNCKPLFTINIIAWLLYLGFFTEDLALRKASLVERAMIVLQSLDDFESGK